MKTHRTLSRLLRTLRGLTALLTTATLALAALLVSAELTGRDHRVDRVDDRVVDTATARQVAGLPTAPAQPRVTATAQPRPTPRPTVTGSYAAATAQAVSGFQTKRGFPVTGAVDRRTLGRLHAMTTTPTQDQKHNRVPGLDARCRTGRVLCVDKTTRTLRWVVDGAVLTTVEARFGGSSTPTREGTFSVREKSRDHVSSIYGTSMPYAMFFAGGQAVHYSPDFAARGYAGASHGCVNIRDLAGIRALYDQVRVGDRVVVHRS